MNNQDLIRLGVPQGDALKLCYEHMRRLFARGLDREQVEADIFNIVANPPAFFADELRAPLARAIYRPAFTPRAELAPWRQWGEGLEAEAVKQMANACALPVAVAGALMPDGANLRPPRRAAVGFRRCGISRARLDGRDVAG